MFKPISIKISTEVIARRVLNKMKITMFRITLMNILLIISVTALSNFFVGMNY